MRFPNLAGKEADKEVREELELAGIEIVDMPILTKGREVKTRYVGKLHGWVFYRAWYYWSCEGPGIPPDDAKALHDLCGEEARVCGHGCAPDPIEYCHGFAVGSYHVDSQIALKYLADLIKKIYKEEIA